TTAFIDTAAAQGAFAIGEMEKLGTLNAFTHKLAHALAGCAAGAARNGSEGCAAGAIGAAVGEMAAEAYGRRPDTAQFAGMISAIAAAVAGGNAAQINLASAAGVNAAANNRMLHPTDKQLAASLAAKGKYTKEQIEEQMRLMGNIAYGELPNSLAVLTDSKSIGNNIAQDPGMPKAVDGKVVIEVPGQANMEIQQYIIANSKEGAGYIPGFSPYLASNPALNAPITTNVPPLSGSVTAACANNDLACRSGVGVQQSVPMTAAQQQAVGNYFGNMSTQYQRMAALATATGNTPIVLSFEIAAGVTGLLEQAFKPSAGKVAVDSALDVAADRFSQRTGIPRAIVFEVVEREIKPRFEAVKKAVDSGLLVSK
ncbi:MAG: hypothetical protein H0W47_12425, partial [Polaromonas sp.]|uniref:hypothetical protein n=1 Tax=Polaromonas sp. TaxID=1869339 RepID=UPI0017EDF6D5